MEGKDHDGKGQPITQKFREYDSVDEYVKDKIKLLENSYDFKQEDSPEVFAAKLDGDNKGKRRWAEDPEYASKMVSVFGGNYNVMPTSWSKSYEARKAKLSPPAQESVETEPMVNEPVVPQPNPTIQSPITNNTSQEDYYKGLLEIEQKKFDFEMNK